MKDYIQRYTQQQVARFLTLALIPAVLAGTAGTIASYFTMIPVYALGLYIYIGYRNIGWKSPTRKSAKRTWAWSMYFNAFLFLASLVMFGETIIEFRDPLSMLGAFAYMACVGAISLTSYYTKQNLSSTKAYDGIIAEIGVG